MTWNEPTAPATLDHLDPIDVCHNRQRVDGASYFHTLPGQGQVIATILDFAE